MAATDLNEERRSPYVLVVGCPRSGTTLMQRMLDSHPDLAVSNDTRSVPRSRLKRVENPDLTAEIVEAIVSFKRFPRFGIPPERARAIAARAVTLRDFLTALFSEYASLRKKPLSGEKTPDYVCHLPTLVHLFPWAKIVHVVRDGRDVALSMLEWAGDRAVGPSKSGLWREDPVATCALFWGWHVSMGMRDGSDLGAKSYHQSSYEELVRDPESSLRTVFAFLDLPFSRYTLRYYEGRRRYGASLSAKSAWLPPTPGLRDWRTQMDMRDLEMFEALAGDLLSTLGYDRACGAPSSSTSRRAALYRARWENEMTRRHPHVSFDRIRSFT